MCSPSPIRVTKCRNRLQRSCARCRFRCWPGSIPVDTSGFSTLSGVNVGRRSRDSKRVESVQRYACDTLAISGGWCPSLHLYSQAGSKLLYRDDIGAFEPVAAHPVVTFAGSVADRSQNEARYISCGVCRTQTESTFIGSAAGRSLHGDSWRSAAVSIGRSALTQPWEPWESV